MNSFVTSVLFFVVNCPTNLPLIIHMHLRSAGAVNTSESLYLLLLLDLTLAVPVANSLTFVATAVCGWSVGEEAPDRSEWKVVLLQV